MERENLGEEVEITPKEIENGCAAEFNSKTREETREVCARFDTEKKGGVVAVRRLGEVKMGMRKYSSYKCSSSLFCSTFR